MIKKADIILACILIVTGLTMSYIFSFGDQTAKQLQISCCGEHFGSYPLDEDREIVVDRNGHINKVTIKDGYVSMEFSDCSGQDCVHQGKISKTGETIICLPNKIVLEISGSEDGYDAIAH